MRQLYLSPLSQYHIFIKKSTGNIAGFLFCCGDVNWLTTAGSVVRTECCAQLQVASGQWPAGISVALNQGGRIQDSAGIGVVSRRSVQVLISEGWIMQRGALS